MQECGVDTNKAKQTETFTCTHTNKGVLWVTRIIIPPHKYTNKQVHTRRNQTAVGRNSKYSKAIFDEIIANMFSCTCSFNILFLQLFIIVCVKLLTTKYRRERTSQSNMLALLYFATQLHATRRFRY